MDDTHGSGLRIPNNPRFLFVDDEPAVLRGLKRIVASVHPEWEVTLASNGEQALEKLNTQHYHVVLTDLQMPVMNGLALLRAMTTSHSETLRIVHSSHIETTGRELVRYLAHNVLSKPATAYDVLSMLEWAVRGVRSAPRSRQDSSVCA
jgi:YesN/AraC family two-component response regulator